MVAGPQAGEQGAEIRGRRLAEHEALPRGRVHERQQLGVQRQPAQGDRVGRGLAVDRVAEHGVPEVREVDAHLVRAPGPELGLDERQRPEALQRAQHGAGEPPSGPGCESRPPGPRPRPADAPLHELLPGELAAHDREVAAIHGVGAELALQVFGGGVGEREDEQARGVAVEAMDHEHAVVPAGSSLELGGGPRQDGVVLPLAGRVDHEARGLADHEHIRIDVEHLDGGGLRDTPAAGQRRVVGDDVAGRRAHPGRW